MRRLSIIDLAGGHQPTWNESKDVAVIFNGELYNYRDLRERLALCGHRFSTQSDTEILVHAWEEWGEDCLTELRGMFAFALLDLRERYATAPILLLARDPLGIKPLYYTQTPEGFAFASEIRALLASGVLPKRLSQDAVTSYLLFGSVSEPVTLLEGVFSLPPGHRMLLHVPERRRVPRARPWWDLAVSPAAREPRKPRDLASAAKQLRPLLEDAVRGHLIADVPVGLFLSSGLDSAAIAALAAQARGGIESFTLTFPGTAFDEGELARLAANRFKTKHTEVPLSGESMVTRLDEALAALDQPALTGLPPGAAAALAEVLAEARLHAARGGRDRQRPPTAGNDSRQKITFTGHILAAILSRRFALPARAIAALFGCDRSTIGHELPRTRQLLTATATAIPPGPLTLATYQDLRDYAATAGITLPDPP